MTTNLLGQEIPKGEGVAVGTLEEYIVATEEHFEKKGEVSDARDLFAGAINATRSEIKDPECKCDLFSIAWEMVQKDKDRQNWGEEPVFCKLALQIVDELTARGSWSIEDIKNLNLDTLVVAMNIFHSFVYNDGNLEGFKPRDVSAFVGQVVGCLRDKTEGESSLELDRLYYIQVALGYMMYPLLAPLFEFQDSALADYLTFFLPLKICDSFRIIGPNFIDKVTLRPGILDRYPDLAEVLRQFYIRDSEVDQEKPWYNLDPCEKHVLNLLWQDKRKIPEAIKRRLKLPARE